MSASTEEYLEALYKLTQDGSPASTSAISRSLNIAPASVTEMVQKLADNGYVEYSPYRGATLTPQGYRLAEKMTRKHRLLELFLHKILKISMNRVHQEACEMEHALSDETARAMCQTLKSPYKCPDDGQVIPPCDLGFSSCEECRKWGQANLDKIGRRDTSVIAISSLPEGQAGVIGFIRGDSQTLRRLVDLGLTPGTKVIVGRAASPGGPVEITRHGSKLSLGDEIACNVFVTRADK
jgi:DtxR family Mn-dependent transcriptional regulator